MIKGILFFNNLNVSSFNLLSAKVPSKTVESVVATCVVLGIKTEEAVVIDDTAKGMSVARSAKCFAVGTSEKLLLSGADLVVSSLSDIKNFNKDFEEKIQKTRSTGKLGELFTASREVLKNAYAPYSHYRVGAAILTGKNNIYSGCNVENASFGGTICAERGAAMQAIAKEGKTEFKALVISSEADEPAPPCAICRQFLSEFSGPDMQVYLVSLKSKVVRHYNFSTVMPLVFEL